MKDRSEEALDSKHETTLNQRLPELEAIVRSSLVTNPKLAKKITDISSGVRNAAMIILAIETGANNFLNEETLKLLLADGAGFIKTHKSSLENSEIIAATEKLIYKRETTNLLLWMKSNVLTEEHISLRIVDIAEFYLKYSAQVIPDGEEIIAIEDMTPPQILALICNNMDKMKMEKLLSQPNRAHGYIYTDTGGNRHAMNWNTISAVKLIRSVV